MPPTSPASYALLGLLATRSWTGYELTQQVQRSLRFVWPTSEGHLYREQKRLVDMGWVTVDTEPVGERTRKRYAITAAGRATLERWLTTDPQVPQLHIEGLLRAFYADRGEVADLTSALRSTAEQARSLHDEMLGFVDEYLDDDGPMSMLERDVGGPDGERLEFHGRPMFPERLHAVALAIDLTTHLLDAIEQAFDRAAAEVVDWPSTTSRSLTPRTRARLEATRARGSEARP